MKTLKPIREVQNNLLRFSPSEISNRIAYIKKQLIDFDVYLPSRGFNLQRDFVWTLGQKQELINSLLLGKHIPHISYINICLPNYTDKIQIIDGKQRLSSIFDFLDDKFPITFEGNDYLFSELPDDYQREITGRYLRAYCINEEKPNQISDDDKIQWFTYLNFSGTPQDKEHFQKLTNK